MLASSWARDGVAVPSRPSCAAAAPRSASASRAMAARVDAGRLAEPATVTEAESP